MIANIVILQYSGLHHSMFSGIANYYEKHFYLICCSEKYPLEFGYEQLESFLKGFRRHQEIFKILPSTSRKCFCQPIFHVLTDEISTPYCQVVSIKRWKFVGKVTCFIIYVSLYVLFIHLLLCISFVFLKNLTCFFYPIEKFLRSVVVFTRVNNPLGPVDGET